MCPLGTGHIDSQTPSHPCRAGSVDRPSPWLSFLVRLDDSELDALRQAAKAQGRSMNDLARQGLRRVTTDADRDARVRSLARRVMSEHADLLKRLGEA